MFSMNDQKFQIRCEIIRKIIVSLRKEIETEEYHQRTNRIIHLKAKLAAYEDCYNIFKAI